MSISENSRIWIYQANRSLSNEEQVLIQQKLDDFTSQWLAHGHSLAAQGEIRHQQFIIISVDEEVAGATGCSIDKSVYLLKEIENELDLNLFDRFRIAYRIGNEVVSCSRQEFEQLINTGKVNSETIVFNNMISSRKELERSWETSLKNSWHAQIFADQINT
ncbi:MAG: ABC transporter ATPase [Daejeonella sp.]